MSEPTDTVLRAITDDVKRRADNSIRRNDETRGRIEMPVRAAIALVKITDGQGALEQPLVKVGRRKFLFRLRRGVSGRELAVQFALQFFERHQFARLHQLERRRTDLVEKRFIIHHKTRRLRACEGRGQQRKDEDEDDNEDE